MKWKLAENGSYTRQNEQCSIAFAACTDAATTHRAVDDAFEPSVHVKDAMRHEI